MARPDNDAVTLAIGQAVQRYLMASLDLPPLAEVTGVEAHAVGELDTGLVVTTADQGNRYFLVRVREFAAR